MRKNQKKFGWLLVLAILVLLVAAYFLLQKEQKTEILSDQSATEETTPENYRVEENTPATTPVEVKTFADCVRAGFAVTETNPRQCKTADGKTFTEAVNMAPTGKDDLIKVEVPASGTKLTSPLEIKGQARGSWYSEGGFPVYLYDANKKLLGRGIASAQGEWMTEKFVPFKLTLQFEKSTTPTGTLILRKDNPSNLPEHDNALELPVAF